MQNQKWGLENEVQDNIAVRWRNNTQWVTIEYPISPLPIRLVYRENPRILKKFDEPNKTHKDYKNIVIQLIFNGWNFEQIYNQFEDIQPTYYITRKDPIRYLVKLYNSMLTTLLDDPIRIELADIYKYATLKPWSGRWGDFNQRALLAIIATGYQFATFSPKVSLRDISKHAGFGLKGGHVTALNAVKRLEKIGLKVKRRDRKINQFDLSFLRNVKKDLNGDILLEEQPELWAQRRGLGGTCKLILSHLSNEPIKNSDLVNLTGKHRNTIKNNLEKLQKSDLAIQLDNKKWIRGKSSLENVARTLNSKSWGKVKRRIIRRQRRKYKLNSKSKRTR
jgi:hypothetical protein